MQSTQTSTALVHLLSSTTAVSQSATPSASAPVKNHIPLGIGLLRVWILVAIIGLGAISFALTPILICCLKKHDKRKAEQAREAELALRDAQRQQTLM
jgi:hypothetical protein